MRRALAFVAFALGTFVVFSLVWIFGVLGAAAFGKDPNGDGVREFLASEVAGWVSLFVGIVIALAVSWAVILRGSRK